jgi:hypothetical protein
MILMKNGDYTLEHDPRQGYAVFKRVCYPSGTTAFWQQISKWYQYKKYAVDIYNGRQQGEN